MRAVIYNKLPKESMEIRVAVFVEEQGFVDKPDETDEHSVHILLYDDMRAIATCRVYRKERTNDYILGRFAVITEYRGRGIGRMLLCEAEKYVASVNGKALVLHSQYHAKDFYIKCGYEQMGGIEYEQGEPHVWMGKYLKNGNNLS